MSKKLLSCDFLPKSQLQRQSDLCVSQLVLFSFTCPIFSANRTTLIASVFKLVRKLVWLKTIFAFVPDKLVINDSFNELSS